MMGQDSLVNRVKQVRQYYQQTQKSFAGSLGIEQSYLSFIERSNSKPSRKVTDALCSVFYVNPEWLEFGNGAMLIGNGEIPLNTIRQIKQTMPDRKYRIDRERLANALEDVEELLTSMQKKLSNNDKAYMVALLYEHPDKVSDFKRLLEIAWRRQNETQE